jgi:hypothetical protein
VYTQTQNPADARCCQYIIWNLLEIPDKAQLPRADSYIRELFQTTRCGVLADVREAYCKYLGREILQRVLDRQVQDPEVIICEDAVWHYQKWTRERLIQELSLWDRAGYYLYTFRAEFLALLGLGGVGAGWRWLHERGRHATLKRSQTSPPNQQPSLPNATPEKQ